MGEIGRKIGVFEDDPGVLEILGHVLSESGHELTVWATTMEESRPLIDRLGPGDIDAAIVDANLSGGSSGEDGDELLRQLRARLVGVVIISFSSSRPIEGADYAVDKGRPWLDLIPAIIGKL